jgi:glutaredoxin
VYSDLPPADGRIQKILEIHNPPSSPLPAATFANLEQLRRTKAKASGITPTRGIVLYSAAWCGYCKLAKAYLANNRISYLDVDIDTKEGLSDFAQAGGHKGIPLLVAGDRRVQGFSSAAYEAFFAKSR